MLAAFLWSCGRSSHGSTENVSHKTVMQQEDGTILLRIEDAACYYDNSDPSVNTAEWIMTISRAGSYKVWLSSATKDTSDLDYTNYVKIHFLDREIEADPDRDKIVRNSEGGNHSLYRTDSYMGTFYIMEPGNYQIQVVSDKIIPGDPVNPTASLVKTTKVMSLFLAPMTR